MDYSTVTPWVIVLSGIAAAVLIGRVTAVPNGLAVCLLGAVVAAALGLGLMYIAASVHSECIAAKRCTTHGDGNISFWIYPLFGIPLYWIGYIFASLSAASQ